MIFFPSFFSQIFFVFSADSLATDPKTGFPLFQPMIPIRMTSSLSPGRGGDRGRGRECKSLSPMREKRTEFETERSRDNGDVRNNLNQNKNNFINFSSTLEYPGKRNLQIQIPSEVSSPKGIRRKPSEVYRDLIRKDEERQERVRRAQLEAEVTYSFLLVFNFYLIFIFIVIYIAHGLSWCLSLNRITGLS